MRNKTSIRNLTLTLGLVLVAAATTNATPQQGSVPTFVDCDGDGADDAVQISSAPEMDANFNSMLDLCEGLSVDRLTLSVSEGGRQRLHMDLGPNAAYRLYWVLGSTAGTDPGITLGSVRLPLNLDGDTGYMRKTTLRPNKDELVNTLGFLDQAGMGNAYLVLPPGSDPALAGTIVHHAFVIFVAGAQGGTIPLWSSNAVSLELLP